MVDRSPKFPSIGLGEAIDAIRLIYHREGRSAMPRLSAVRPLGYSSINGRSLSIIGALRGYGLLDGRGDDVRLSQDAITILNAPEKSSERQEALRRAFEAPSAFALLRSKGDSSPETLRWHLIKANFRDEAADRLLKVYLESRGLIEATLGADPENTDDEVEGTASGKTSTVPQESELNQATASSGVIKKQASTPLQPQMAEGERLLQAGMLSRQTSYRVLVSGPVGGQEIDRLIRKLELDKDFLAEGASEQVGDAPLPNIL